MNEEITSEVSVKRRMHIEDNTKNKFAAYFFKF